MNTCGEFLSLFLTQNERTENFGVLRCLIVENFGIFVANITMKLTFFCLVRQKCVEEKTGFALLATLYGTISLIVTPISWALERKSKSA